MIFLGSGKLLFVDLEKRGVEALARLELGLQGVLEGIDYISELEIMQTYVGLRSCLSAPVPFATCCYIMQLPPCIYFFADQ